MRASSGGLSGAERAGKIRSDEQDDAQLLSQPARPARQVTANLGAITARFRLVAAASHAGDDYPDER